MAEVRGDDWLPEGWKVEVRVRKSGKRDRYYRDPANGYVFRSLKDIDRYLVTGKLGRRAMKPKKDDPVDDAPVKVQADDVSKEKDSNPSNGSKKEASSPCQKRNSARSGKRKPASGGSKSNQKSKNKKISESPRREESDDFFTLDSDQGADITNELGLPNLPEMIDSARKSDATYLSAPEIAVLLGRQMPSEGAANRKSPALQAAAAPKLSDFDSPMTFPWGDIFSDPCIEFAIKTLTGEIPLASASDDSLGAQKSVDTSEAPNDKMSHENDV